MKTIFYKNLKAFTLCAGFFSLAACKEKSSVKPDLIPGVDNIHTFEVNSFNVTVNNSYRDSLWTNDYSYQVVGIGGITSDVVFGKTAAGVYMQFTPPSANFTFPAQVIIDSSVLMLPYTGVAYADTVISNPNHALRLNAYQIIDPFTLGTDGTRKYYSFDKLAYNTVPVGSGTFSLKQMTDTLILANGDTVTHMLRMRMTTALNDQFKNMDPQYLTGPTVFQDYFRGIFLAPDTTQQQNTIAYFVLSGAANAANYSIAQMEFYYHTQSDNTPKRSFFRFNPLTSSFFSSIKRNYNGTPAAGYLNNTQNSDTLFVQSYPGFRSDISINIDNNTIPQSVINKAALTITVLKTGDDTRFNAPPQLIIRSLNTDGTERVVADILNNDDSTTNSTGVSFVGGLPKKATINGTDYLQYTFNIPREVQRAKAEGKTTLKLRVLGTTSYQGSFRMIGGGPNAPAETRLKFDVIYTKLN